MNGKPWTHEEIQQVGNLAGDMPFPMVVEAYNRWAERNGLPERTYHSIRTRAMRMGYPTSAFGEWLTARDISIRLGASAALLHHWIKRGWIKGRRYSDAPNAPLYIARSDLRSLARKRPELFSRFKLDDLSDTLGSDSLAERLVQHKKGTAHRRAVMQLSTGRRFPSVRNASKTLGLNPSGLREATIRGWRCGGSYWKFVA